MFNTGDKVKCIEKRGQLQVDKVYTVKSSGMHTVCLVEVEGTFHSYRFIKQPRRSLPLWF